MPQRFGQRSKRQVSSNNRRQLRAWATASGSSSRRVKVLVSWHKKRKHEVERKTSKPDELRKLSARLEVREEAAQEAAEAPPEHLKAELQKLVDELQKHKDCEKGSSSRPTSALKLQAGGGEGRPREQETQMCR